MEAVCPDAWLLNITNPMTTLCRAVTRETEIATVGLCHEVTMAQFHAVAAARRRLPRLRPHRHGGEPPSDRHGHDDRRRRRLRTPARTCSPTPTRGATSPSTCPPGLGHEQHSFGGEWRKRDLLASNRVKFSLFERFGVLPAAGDRHLVEFFPGFLTEESDWGSRWGVGLTSIADREAWQDYYEAEFAELRAAAEVPKLPSGEIVAPLIDSFFARQDASLPAEPAERGPVPRRARRAGGRSDGHRRRRPACAAVTSRPRRRRSASGCAASSASQEATVEAAVTGDREKVVEAMLLDPLAGRIDFDHLVQMTDELLDATKQWLPQFA